MAGHGPSHPKLLHHTLHVFSLKSPSPSSSSSTQLTSSKLKTILQTFIFSHLYRIVGALTKAKSIVIHVLKDIQLLHFIQISMKKNSKNLKNKLFLGSFRMHYNWCSSHVMPVPIPELEGYYSNNHLYYDSSWNAVIPSIDSEQERLDHQDSAASQLSGYLRWLEEKEDNQQGNEIDKLADMFIANCHEKFRLEKQESYRRFQEMMARSI